MPKVVADIQIRTNVFTKELNLGGESLSKNNHGRDFQNQASCHLVKILLQFIVYAVFITVAMTSDEVQCAGITPHEDSGHTCRIHAFLRIIAPPPVGTIV